MPIVDGRVTFEYTKVVSPIIKPGDTLPAYPWTGSSFDAFQHKWAVRNVTNGREVARGTAASKAAAQTAVDAAYTAAVSANSAGSVQYPVEVPAFDAP